MDSNFYREKYQYFETFEVIFNGAFAGFEIPFLKTPLGKKCKRNKKLMEIVDRNPSLQSLQNRPERTVLYEHIIQLISDYGKKIFLPHRETGFNELWSDREIKLFSNVIVPSADFVIWDIFARTNFDSLLSDAVRDSKIPMVFIDDNENLLKYLSFKCIYPVISTDHTHIVNGIETFLKKLYQ